MYRRNTGRRGENLAGRYLVSRRYTILERNYRTPFGEIDIVAERDGVTVFLEIKTRISEKAGPPLASITAAKQRHMIRSCQYYLLKHDLADTPCRIDAISVNLDQDCRLKVLKHLKNAFGTEAAECRHNHK